jgi:hypothetical protein
MKLACITPRSQIKLSIGSAVFAWALFTAQPLWFVHDWATEVNWLLKTRAKERQLAATTDHEKITDRASCEARGGKWGRLGGMSNRIGCNIPYSDGGTTCSDPSECQGECMVEYDSEYWPKGKRVKEYIPGPPATGICAPWRIMFGCFEYVIRGNVVPGPCID